MKESLSALRDISKNHKSALLRITKQVNLTIAEWQLLVQIIDGSATQEVLSKTTGLDTSTLSRQLKHIEAKEMIAKTQTGRDKRQLIYNVTELGLTSVERINQDYASLKEQIFDRWTDEENNLLQILLNRLDKSINRILSKNEK